MIYLNNAATTFPKPPSVVKAMTAALTHPPVSSLRSNATAGDDLLTELRKELGKLFNIADWERIFFCSSATDAVNRIVGGVKVADIEVDADSHNSVLRPLANQAVAEADADFIARLPLMEVVNHCSNVTGRINPIKKGKHILMLDAAQSAGCIPIDVDGRGIDILVFTGHKSLFGPTGTGGYYVRRGIDLHPTQFGGTGRDSSVVKYEDGHWEYEVGTQNTVGLAGLKAGVEYVLERGVENIFRKIQDETNWLIGQLRAIDRIKLYSPCGKRQGPVVSFNIDGLQPADVGYILQNSYDITVRTGLHCAPLIHDELGTAPYGTVRVSLSDLTTHEELESFLSAIHEIANSL